MHVTRFLRRRALLAALGALVVGGVACVSPEASRKRDGGRGADPGNWKPEAVDLHNKEDVYNKTPRVTSPGYR